MVVPGDSLNSPLPVIFYIVIDYSDRNLPGIIAYYLHANIYSTSLRLDFLQVALGIKSPPSSVPV